jgi:hypothetical protein
MKNLRSTQQAARRIRNRQMVDLICQHNASSQNPKHPSIKPNEQDT